MSIIILSLEVLMVFFTWEWSRIKESLSFSLWPSTSISHETYFSSKAAIQPLWSSVDYVHPPQVWRFISTLVQSQGTLSMGATPGEGCKRETYGTIEQRLVSPSSWKMQTKLLSHISKDVHSIFCPWTPEWFRHLRQTHWFLAFSSWKGCQLCKSIKICALSKTMRTGLLLGFSYKNYI